MVTMQAWTYKYKTEGFYVMIRNHKTSRALVLFKHYEHAVKQTEKINKYHWTRIQELYKEAVSRNLMILRDEDLDFTSQKPKAIDIEKGDQYYGIMVWVDGKKYLVAKRKYKKDIATVLRTMRDEHTDEQIIALTRQYLSKAVAK